MTPKILNLGCWTVYVWHYRNRTRLQEMCIEWIERNAASFGQFDLDKLWIDFLSFKKEQIAIGAKDTVTSMRQRGATNGHTGQVDHYSLYLRDKTRGNSFLCISEPVGTEIKRSQLPSNK